MSFELMFIGIIVVIILIIISLFFGDYNRIRFSSQVIISGILTFIMFQLLFFLQGSLDTPPHSAPFENKLVAVAAIILFFNTLIQFGKWLITELLVNRRRVHIPLFAIDLITLFLILFISLFAVSLIFNIELTGIVVSSTVATAIVGIGLQSIVKNLFEGILLQIESPFAIGDWVEVAGQEAKVVRQSWRTLALLTRHNSYIRITYNDVSADKIINYSRPMALQAQDAFIGAPDTHPPNEIKEILCEAVIGVDGVLADPPPRTHIVAYGDTDISYRVRYWIDDFEAREDIYDEVLTRFWYALRRANIDMPTPMRDVNVRMIAEDSEERAQEKQYKETLTLLQEVPIFNKLTGRQIRQLAEMTQQKLYAAGEYLIKQGDTINTLFIIKSGLVAIYSKQNDGTNCFIDQLSAHNFFGEMSLITKRPHRASVVAQTETQVITIKKTAFSEVLLNDTAMLALFLNELDNRRSNLVEKQREKHKKTKTYSFMIPSNASNIKIEDKTAD